MNKYFLPVYHSQLKPWIKWWILKRLNGGESSLKAVTISSGTLTKVDKSKALSIKEYYGNTVQNGTPTPSSPIEVKTVSGDNEVVVCGENWFNKEEQPTLYLGTIWTAIDTGIRATSNAVGTWKSAILVTKINLRNYTGKHFWLHAEPQQASSNNTPYFALGRCDKTGNTRTVIDGSSTYGKTDISITIPSIAAGDTQEYLYIAIASSGNGNTYIGDYIDYNNVMLLYEKNYTTYEPYIGNSYRVDFGGIELCKIGDFKDKIINDNGTWKVEKNIGKVVLNGSENWIKHGSIASWFYYDGVTNGYFNNATDNFALTNYFVQKSYSSVVNLTNGEFAYGSSDNGATHRLVCKDTNYTATQDFKNWLSTHNVSLYYQLATPTTETITNTNLISQLNALYEFYVNSSTVTISNNSEIPLEVLLEYYGR